MPQNPHNTSGKPALKNYNQFRSARSEALRWLQITIATVMKLKVETTVKKEIKNYWTSLPLMYLIFNKNILQVKT